MKTKQPTNKSLADFQDVRDESIKLSQIANQRRDLDAKIMSVQVRIANGATTQHESVLAGATAVLAGRALDQTVTDNTAEMHILQYQRDIIGEAERLQSLKLQAVHEKVSAAIANGAMAAYGAVVQRALDAAKTMLEIGDELAEWNSTLSHEQVTSLDGGQRRLIMTPAPA